MVMFEKIKNFILMDVADENETKKASVIMRFTSMFFYLFFTIQTLVLFIYGYPRAAVISLVCLLGYLCAFIMTYQGYTIITQHFIELITLAWIASFVAIMGWDCSYQHMLFALLLFSLLTSYQDIRYKAIYTGFLCIFRIALYFYIHCYDAYYTADHSTIIFFTIYNTASTFLLFFIISFLFSKDSMEMEQKLVKYNKKIEKLAKTDTLTKLPNRRDALERIEKHLKHSKDADFHFDLAIGDIDFFKRVNDTYGHEAGDAVLVQMADLFREVMDKQGFVARWGGEEFLFVFTQFNGDDAAIALNELRSRISHNIFTYNDLELRLTMTFGLEEYDFHSTIDDVVNSADEKLYIGKTKGRNQVVF